MPVSAGCGTMIHFYNFIIFTDITDLKIQEARVSESEQRFRMMADNIQDGLFIVENDKVVFSNRRIKEITGYSFDEMAKMGLHGTLVTDEIQAIADSGIIPVTETSRIEEIFRKCPAGFLRPGRIQDLDPAERWHASLYPGKDYRCTTRGYHQFLHHHLGYHGFCRAGEGPARAY